MEESVINKEHTVLFVPERLNRDPVVVRGLTNNELFGVVGIGVVTGLGLGILAWILVGEVALIPSGIALCGALSLFLSGSILRRLKRGRPDTWLYRNIQWSLARRNIRLGSPPTLRSGPWSARREHDRAEDRLKEKNNG